MAGKISNKFNLDEHRKEQYEENKRENQKRPEKPAGLEIPEKREKITTGTPITEFKWQKYEWERLMIGEHKDYQDCADPPLSSTTRHVLHVLISYMNGTVEYDGVIIEVGELFRCFPSQRRIAVNAGLNKNTVRTHLKIAEQRGWIIRERLASGKGRERHQYIPCVPETVKKR